MMKKILFIIYYLLFILNSKGQNLVPNGDFETYSLCPTAPNQMNLAVPWYDPTGATPDYYNACAAPTSLVGVPFQSNGAVTVYQNAHSGHGYAGLFTTQNNGSDYREYIQILLANPLVSGRCYVVSFYANLANLLKYGSNNIGAYLSTNPITTTAPNVLNYTPQILLAGNTPIVDTVNWIKVSGIYSAIGGEIYITIGNFQDDNNTTTQLVDSLNPFDGCYYYIDDVSVMDCNDTSTSVQETKNDYIFSLYPNPSTGSFSINYDLKQSNDAVFKLYDIRGKLLNETVLKSENTSFDFSDVFVNGIYFYQVSINNKMIKSDKVVIIK